MAPTAPRPRSYAELCERIERLDANLELIRQSVAALVEQRSLSARFRPPDLSWHDFDEDVAQLRATLGERVRDPSRFDSVRARAVVQKAIASAQRDDKADRYDAITRTTVKILVGVLVGVGVAMALAHFGLHP